MKWGYCLIRNWYNLLYAVVTSVYLVRLVRLNEELLAEEFATAFELLLYKDAAAIKFFGMALLLFLLGIIFISVAVRLWRKAESFEEMVSVILTVAVIIMLLLLIIVFIDNPIFRAILSVVLMVGGGVALAAD